MKKSGRSGVDSRSSKHVRFPASTGILGGWSSYPGATLTSNAYTVKVKETFKQRPNVYKEFMAIVAKLQNSAAKQERMEVIERAVTLLDGHPRLINNFAVFLPEGYAIEIQEDAVIIKVFESDDNAYAVDTGNSRPLQTTPQSSMVQGYRELSPFGTDLVYPRSNTKYSSSPKPGRNSRTRKKSDRRQASASGVRRSLRRSTDGSLRRSADRSLRRPSVDRERPPTNTSSYLTTKYNGSNNSYPSSTLMLDYTTHENGLRNNPPQNPGTVAYLMAVKQAFSNRPAVYRQFTDALQRYHASSTNDIDTVREVVSILKAHPHLVLGFNEFLPTGCRIRMYDQTAYVVEHPDEDGRMVQKQIRIK